MLLLTSRTHTDNDLRVSAPTLTSPGNQRLMLGLAGRSICTVLTRKPHCCRSNWRCLFSWFHRGM